MSHIAEAVELEPSQATSITSSTGGPSVKTPADLPWALSALLSSECEALRQSLSEIKSERQPAAISAGSLTECLRSAWPKWIVPLISL